MSKRELMAATALRQDQLEDILESLQKEYRTGHGFVLERFGERYKFVGHEDLYDIAQAHFEQTRQKSLSRAAMETLAIIAYTHPVSRMEIEEIRGVNCDSTLRSLMALDLVEARKQTDQRYVTYQPGPYFLDYFGLSDLSELPQAKSQDLESLFDEKETIEEQVSALFEQTA